MSGPSHPVKTLESKQYANMLADFHCNALEQQIQHHSKSMASYLKVTRG
jgi:hypothetical protein